MNFDLNIENYQIQELREIFDLPVNFDLTLIEQKDILLKENVWSNQEINQELKKKTIDFLSKAKELLIKKLNENPGENIKNGLKEVYREFYNSNYQLKPTVLESPEQHMVQVDKQSPFLSSYPSEYFPGVINPLKRRVNRLNLNVDTRFRNNYFSTQSSNFHFDLPLRLSNILSMQLSSIELPTSFYSISKSLGNSFFTISITVDPSGSGVSETYTNTINVSNGNYTPDTLMTFLNTMMTNLGGFFQYVYFTANLYQTLTGSGQVVVGINSQFATDYPEVSLPILTLDFQSGVNGLEDKSTPLPLKFGWILGFRNGLYVNNSTYVSEGLLDLSGPRYMYLVVDDYNNNFNDEFYSVFNSSILNKNILARISLNTGFFTIMEQNNLSLITNPRQYFGPVTISSVTIQLLDEYGRILDLNNMDYSFCLTFQTVYDLQ